MSRLKFNSIAQLETKLRQTLRREVERIERFIKKSHAPDEVMMELLQVQQNLVDALEWPETNEQTVRERYVAQR